jgi:hypothetical protein
VAATFGGLAGIAPVKPIDPASGPGLAAFANPDREKVASSTPTANTRKAKGI